MSRVPAHEYIQTVVIGGGQSGLSVGYHLKRRGLPFLILEAHDRIGDSWRQRWKSLRLFTPARFDGLDGLPFPAPAHSFPTKDEMAGYLETYAKHFELPIRTHTRVDRLSREGSRYLISARGRRIEAEHVVIAMSTFQRPRVPPFARELKPEIVQLHSFEYRGPEQLKDGGVLIVGAGNSGAEIAVEVTRRHRTWMSGRDTGHVPFRVEGLLGRLLIPFVFRVVFHRILTVKTPIGRKARPHIVNRGGTLIRVKPKDLAASGVERVPRVVGVRNGLPLLEGDRELDAANVIWCTGFNHGLTWVDVPVFDSAGEPIHDSGIALNEPGLYFVGLHFLYAMSSTMIHGVGRDAARVASAIESRVRANAHAGHPTVAVAG
jgi:putative flavoprotein involved in K+ transport